MVTSSLFCSQLNFLSHLLAIEWLNVVLDCNGMRKEKILSILQLALFNQLIMLWIISLKLFWHFFLFLFFLYFPLLFSQNLILFGNALDNVNANFISFSSLDVQTIQQMKSEWAELHTWCMILFNSFFPILLQAYRFVEWMDG